MMSTLIIMLMIVRITGINMDNQSSLGWHLDHLDYWISDDDDDDDDEDDDDDTNAYIWLWTYCNYFSRWEWLDDITWYYYDYIAIV